MTFGKFTIGLNETAVGMVVPSWFIDTTKNTISVRDAEHALTTGRMFTTEEALKVGMIYEVATDKADAVAKCKKFIGKFDKIPPFARSVTKLRLRQSAIKKLQDSRQADADGFLELILNPATQESLKMYLDNFKKKA